MINIRKIISITIIILVLNLLIAYTISIKASFLTSHEGPEVTESMIYINEDGTSQEITYTSIINQEKKTRNLQLETYDTSPTLENTIIYLKSSSNVTGNNYLTYKNVSNPGYDGYTTGAYAKDAAYLGTVNGKIRGMQAGVVMDFNPDDVTLIATSNANISYYYQLNGFLYHKIYFGGSGASNTYRVGFQQSYLKDNIHYYSYDGHYFYTDYAAMIQDYQKDIRNHSINPQNPYYNYFQFLSHRSKTTLTAADLDNLTNSKTNDNSKMRNLGNSYISHQNTYGVNALLMYGVSANESAWGSSAIAQNKNNLFGHGAVDSNPYYGASGYNTPSDSIKYHAEKFISQGYLDNEDWRYNGGHLGDKSGGINVRYASDPYWGEKAASIYYYNGNGKDFNKYQLGIIQGVQSLYKLYKDPDYSSKVIHILGNERSPKTYNLPVIVLGEVKDSSGNKWYKVQSDTTLNASRTDTDWDNIYNFDRDYVYIPAKGVSLINQGTSIEKIYLPGDVNGDDKVTSLDYIKIKNHIMETKILNDDEKIRADVNKDGKISSLDYIKIKNHIMGVKKLY